MVQMVQTAQAAAAVDVRLADLGVLAYLEVVEVLLLELEVPVPHFVLV